MNKGSMISLMANNLIRGRNKMVEDSRKKQLKNTKEKCVNQHNFIMKPKNFMEFSKEIVKKNNSFDKLINIEETKICSHSFYVFFKDDEFQKITFQIFNGEVCYKTYFVKINLEKHNILNEMLKFLSENIEIKD